MEYPTSRSEARQTGTMYYFTGKPCPHRHVMPRYTSNSACVTCITGRTLDVEVHEQVALVQEKRAKKLAQALGALRDTQRKDRQLLRKWLRTYKSHNPCIDCGLVYAWYVMEFDHRDGRNGQEDKTVAQCFSAGMGRLLQEIEKCDLVCANCHKVRTYRRAVGEGKIHDDATL